MRTCNQNNGTAPPTTEPASLPRQRTQGQSHGFPTLPDELNPTVALQTLATQMLVRLVNNPDDAHVFFSAMLALRGCDANGRWVGFKQAQALHAERMMNRGLPHEIQEVPGFFEAACTRCGCESDPRHIFALMLQTANINGICAMGIEALEAKLMKADKKAQANGAEYMERFAISRGIL